MVKLVRALFDYKAQDAGNLSFFAGDVIQVFTILESGWWDGLCRNKRGWFPSNYVTPITIRSQTEEAAWAQKFTSDGKLYWYNALTGESTWHQHTSDVIVLPEHWVVQESPDSQNTFFYNQATAEVHWTLPQELWHLTMPPAPSFICNSDLSHIDPALLHSPGPSCLPSSDPSTTESKQQDPPAGTPPAPLLTFPPSSSVTSMPSLLGSHTTPSSNSITPASPSKTSQMDRQSRCTIMPFSPSDPSCHSLVVDDPSATPVSSSAPSSCATPTPPSALNVAPNRASFASSLNYFETATFSEETHPSEPTLAASASATVITTTTSSNASSGLSAPNPLLPLPPLPPPPPISLLPSILESNPFDSRPDSLDKSNVSENGFPCHTPATDNSLLSTSSLFAARPSSKVGSPILPSLTTLVVSSSSVSCASTSSPSPLAPRSSSTSSPSSPSFSETTHPTPSHVQAGNSDPTSKVVTSKLEDLSLSQDPQDSVIDSSNLPPLPPSPLPVGAPEPHSPNPSEHSFLYAKDSATYHFPNFALMLPTSQTVVLSPVERQMQAWALLTQQIFSAIHKLHKGAKANLKNQYILSSSKIVDAIRSMLVASKAADKESPVIKGNPSLKSHHRALLGALSKLVLSAKLASGVWPPPDAVQKMIMDASELLTCVRKFVEVARDSGVEVLTDIIEQHQQALAAMENTPPSMQGDSYLPLSAEEYSTRRPSSPMILNPPATPCSSTSFSSIKSVPLSECILQQLDGLSQNVLDTLKKLEEQTHQSITVATLISLTRNAVTQVGQFLSLIEDIHLEKGPECPLLHEFKVSKQSLYNNIAGLVMATQTVTAASPPENAMDQVLLSIKIVEKSVTEVLMATRQLLNTKYYPPPTIELNLPSLASHLSSEPSYLPSQLPQIERSAPTTTPRSHLVLNTQLANSYSTSTSPSMPSLSSYSVTPNSTPDHPFSHAPAPASATLASLSSASPSVATPLTSSKSPGVNSTLTPSSIPSVSLMGSYSTAVSPPTTPASAKLRKFFGDDADAASKEALSRSQQRLKEETPWFLQKDHQPFEIVFNLEGQVKGGTVTALVERLTMHSKYDPSFTSAFLLTYRTFMTTQDLFDALVARFSIKPPEGLTITELETWIEKKMTPIRLRVFNVMKSWLENYCLPYIPDDQQILDPMRQFARCVIRPVMSLLSISMTKLIDKREASTTPHLPLRGPQPTTPIAHLSAQIPLPSPVVPRSLQKFRFVDVDPLEIARQLTLIEFSLFSRIIYTEFLNKAWSCDRGVSDSEARARAPNLRRMIEMSNRLTCWVADTILGEEDPRRRCFLVKHFIMVANYCRNLHNFNTLFAILAALHSAPIHRLSRTWDMVSPKTLCLMNELTNIIDPHKNFLIYRELLHTLAPPCIPFLGRYLSDLTFLEDGQPNVLKPIAKEPHLLLINFGKRFKIAEIIREVQQLQIVPFHLKPVPEIQSFLMEMIDQTSGETASLYEISLSLEPRERDDEKLFRLLEESGLL